MQSLSNILIGLVALEHIWFLILEMFLWTKPLGLKLLKMTQEVANSSAVLAKNQGLYNGFLAGGLIWSLLATDPHQSFSLKIFFLSCVMIAGIYGSITADLTILFIQFFPALAAFAVLFYQSVQ